MKKPILVVDDPSETLRELGKHLGQAGYDVTRLRNEDAIDALANSQPEIILVQLYAGGGSGVTLAEQVRQRPDGAIVPILFFGTGTEMVTSVSDALAVGGDYYFQHPLDMVKVIAKIRTYIGIGEAAQMEEEHTAPAGTDPGGFVSVPSNEKLEELDFFADTTQPGTGTAATPLDDMAKAEQADEEAKRRWVEEELRSQAEAESRLEQASTTTLSSIGSDLDQTAAALGVADADDSHLELEAQAEEARRLEREQEAARRRAIEEAALAEEHAERERERIAEAEALEQQRLAEEEEGVRKAAEERIRREIEEETRREVEARRKAEDKLRRDAEERVRLEAEERLRLEREADAERERVRQRKAAEERERARLDAQERERLAEEVRLRARIEAETKARVEAEMRRQGEQKRDEENRRREEETRKRDEENRRREEEIRRREEAAERKREEAEQLRIAHEKEARRREIEETKRRAEEESTRRAEEARRRADEERRAEEAAVLAKQRELQAKEQEERGRIEMEKIIQATVRERLEGEVAKSLSRSSRGATAEELVASEPRPPSIEQGDLGEEDVAVVLARFVTERITGKVRFIRGEQEKLVGFDDGKPIEIVSSDPADRLEEFLLREHLLTRPQYQKCRLKQLQISRQMGAYVVAEGFVKAAELFEVVRTHFEDTLHSLFDWESGTYTFVSTVVPMEDRIVLPVAAERIVADGIRRRYQLPRLLKHVGGPSSLLVTSAGATQRLEAIGLDPKERPVVRLLDGAHSIEDVVFSLGMSEERVYQTLYVLVAFKLADVAVRGVIGPNEQDEHSVAIDRARIREKYEQARKSDYFDFLGLAVTATEYDIGRAIDAVRRVFGKERFTAEVSQELKEELSEIDRVLADAEYVLRDARLRDAYIRHMQRARAS